MENFENLSHLNSCIYMGIIYNQIKSVDTNAIQSVKRIYNEMRILGIHQD